MILFPLPIKRRAPKVIGGAGVYSRTAGDSTVLYSASGRKSFVGAWWTEVFEKSGNGITLTVSQGFVNGFEPAATDGKLISEGLVTGELSSPETWVVLQVEVDKAGRMKVNKQADVTPDNLGIKLLPGARGAGGENGVFGYAPLAVFTDRGPSLEIHQIAYFSYRHSTFRRNPRSPWRHAFHVA